MSELESILRYLLDQIVPADDMSFVRGTLLLIEQQLDVPADALARARALKKRVDADTGTDLFNISLSLPQLFKRLETMRTKKELSDSDWRFVVEQHGLVSKGTILETKNMERLFKLASE